MKKLILAVALLMPALSFAQAHEAWRNSYHRGHGHHNHGHHGHRGISLPEAIVLGTIGAVIYESTRPAPPQVVVVPQPVQGSNLYPCSNEVYYNGEYNPGAARAYCMGVRDRIARERAAVEADAFRRGQTGQ